MMRLTLKIMISMLRGAKNDNFLLEGVVEKKIDG